MTGPPTLRETAASMTGTIVFVLVIDALVCALLIWAGLPALGTVAATVVFGPAGLALAVVARWRGWFR